LVNAVLAPELLFDCKEAQESIRLEEKVQGRDPTLQAL
jgi:hypothetical protein